MLRNSLSRASVVRLLGRQELEDDFAALSRFLASVRDRFTGWPPRGRRSANPDRKTPANLRAEAIVEQRQAASLARRKSAEAAGVKWFPDVTRGITRRMDIADRKERRRWAKARALEERREANKRRRAAKVARPEVTQ